jgi:uncharacterized protein YndB with AHSA1/START domain
MNKISNFEYSIYISSTLAKVWEAITLPDITKQFWLHSNVSNWKKGSHWQHVALDGTIKLIGEVLEVTPEKLLVLTWVNALNVTDYSRVAIDVTPINASVRVAITHNNFKDDSKMFDDIKIGWPMVLSSMKSFLETGEPLITWQQ